MRVAAVPCADTPAYYRPLPKRTIQKRGNFYAVLGLGANHYYHWSHDFIMGMRGVEHLLPADTQLLGAQRHEAVSG